MEIWEDQMKRVWRALSWKLYEINQLAKKDFCIDFVEEVYGHGQYIGHIGKDVDGVWFLRMQEVRQRVSVLSSPLKETSCDGLCRVSCVYFRFMAKGSFWSCNI